MSSSEVDRDADVPAASSSSTAELQPEELSTVTGGVDYAYWHPNGFKMALGRDQAAAMAYGAANPGGQLMQRGSDGAITPLKLPGGD
jgi:hypothetical protein